MNVRLSGKHITDSQIELAVREEVLKIKDIMPPSVRNVQVRVLNESPVAGLFEHINETVHLGADEVRMSAHPMNRLRFILWHEFRHALQYRQGVLKMKNNEAIWKNGKPVSSRDIIKKLYFDCDGYNLLPWEQDANAYAALNVPEYDDRPLDVYPRNKVELKVLF